MFVANREKSHCHGKVFKAPTNYFSDSMDKIQDTCTGVVILPTITEQRTLSTQFRQTGCSLY